MVDSSAGSVLQTDLLCDCIKGLSEEVQEKKRVLTYLM